MICYHVITSDLQHDEMQHSSAHKHVLGLLICPQFLRSRSGWLEWHQRSISVVRIKEKLSTCQGVDRCVHPYYIRHCYAGYLQELTKNVSLKDLVLEVIACYINSHFHVSFYADI